MCYIIGAVGTYVLRYRRVAHTCSNIRGVLISDMPSENCYSTREFLCLPWRSEFSTDLRGATVEGLFLCLGAAS